MNETESNGTKRKRTVRRNVAIVLATVLVISLVVVFFEFYVFRIKEQGIITVGRIMAHPSEWVNRTVNVRGNLSKSTEFEAFLFHSSWVYRLSSDGGSIIVNASANPYIDYSFETNNAVSVVVYGVVEKLSTTSGTNSSVTTNIYYITANRIVIVLSHFFHRSSCLIKPKKKRGKTRENLDNEVCAMHK